MGDLKIVGNSEDDRAGKTEHCDMERLGNDRSQVGRNFDDVIRLGAMPCDADGVGFLKSVGNEQVGCNLAGKDDQGDRVHECIGDAGNGVCSTGSRCDKNDARFSGRARIALGSMGSAGFVADEDVPDFRMLEKRIINGQHSAAGISENGVHTLREQGFDQYVGAAFFGHKTILHPEEADLCCDAARLARAGSLRIRKWHVNP